MVVEHSGKFYIFNLGGSTRKATGLIKPFSVLNNYHGKTQNRIYATCEKIFSKHQSFIQAAIQGQ